MTGYVDPDRPLSLYVHVPFCVRKCSYCAFYSEPCGVWNGEVLDRYTDLVSSQISSFLSLYRHPFDTVFIGGGNPGILGVDRLARILSCASRFGKWRECTVEFNPEQVSLGLAALSPWITRISVGIQSLNADMLSFLGRNSSLGENLRALDILSSLGIPFNTDIITAVPGFTVGDTLCDISRTASFGPDHVSFYCLSYEEGTRMWDNRHLASEEEEAECLREGWKLLSSLGYEHYEISNFARDGAFCQHNLNYWKLGQYIGFGPSSESSLGYRKVVGIRYEQDLASYLEKPVASVEHLDAREAEEEFLMVSLRTKWGVDKAGYRDRFSRSFDQRFSKAVAQLDPCLYLDDEASFRLTEEGFLILDHIVLKLFMCVID